MLFGEKLLETSNILGYYLCNIGILVNNENENITKKYILKGYEYFKINLIDCTKSNFHLNFNLPQVKL